MASIGGTNLLTIQPSHITVKWQNMTTKKQIIYFIFDFEEISESKMKSAMKKDKRYLIKLANQYNKENKKNKEFYRALCIS